MSNIDSNNKESNFGMVLLVLYPILYYYGLPLPFSWGEVLMILFSIVCILRYGRRSFQYPQHYLLFWGYCALILILLHDIKLSYLIPGGISMSVFSVTLAACTIVYDEIKLLKYFRVLFIPLVVLFLYQEYTFISSGSRFIFYLPISSETAYYGDMSFDQLRKLQALTDRSCSMFMEPAYFADFMLVHLCLELFNYDSRNKINNIYILGIVLVLLLLRSGSGIIGLAILGTIKILTLYKYTKSKKSLFFLIVSIPVLLYIAYWYSMTEVGSGLLNRQSEITNQSGSAYDRIFRGFEIYAAMPLLNKLIGIDTSLFRNVASYNGVETVQNGMMFNGLQTVLVSYGLIGLCLMLLICINLYKKGDIVGRSALLLFLSLSLIESIYLKPIMLLLIIIAVNSRKRNDYWLT